MTELPPASDILVVGSGAAGLTAALNLAERFRVTVLAKGALNEGSTARLLLCGHGQQASWQQASDAKLKSFASRNGGQAAGR